MGQSDIAWTVGILLVSGAFVVGFGYLEQARSQSPTTALGTTREAALNCTSDMATKFHIHPRLTIIANGADVPVPADIGIRPSCMNALHTHDGSGVIHVEAPEERPFTIGDFFAVWQQPFGATEVLGYRADATHRIRVTVNGTEVETFETTLLKDRDSIVVSYEGVPGI